uniref:Uncharacterized protein n=1 Tax=Ciona savignyi TaxID=51511 RepID=H2Z0S9_CIOSA
MNKVTVYQFCILPVLICAVLYYCGVFKFEKCKSFPSCCYESATLCYYVLLLPMLVPMFLIFTFFNWMGLMYFKHN